MIKSSPSSNEGGKSTSSVSDEVEFLTRRVEKLKLYSAALTMILMEKCNVTQAEIEEMVGIIDGADGIIDGKMKRTVMKCPKCQKVMNQKSEKCMYCGNSEFPVSFLERI